MTTRSLSTPLHQGLLQQFQTEAEILGRIDALATALGQAGLTAPGLASQQSELFAVVNDLFTVQLHRSQLREAIAADWGCNAELVRLSLVNFESETANSQFHAQRKELQQQTARTGARLRTATQSLRGWHGIVSDLLSTVFASDSENVRYTAAGHRVSPVLQSAVELRS
ncbi:hypothetical protein [Planctomicrobium piriforme]|uniref:Uncharacterized protein n=1 Tax=Planctomicrobium piriforme TaxID=1576369 RepID=A0A1I3HL51_9PLAN|nr:hypothetical protein [Planctomicrobium piriforme]SFI36363.1 hypothetical protein SAMN05421753_108106 [Planctomicrobium piriforme]